MEVRFYTKTRNMGFAIEDNDEYDIRCLYPSKPPKEFNNCGCKKVHSQSCAFFVSDSTTYKYKHKEYCRHSK